ncbi:MAG: HlyD family efflux transporter periplasmic adaptor subunit [Synechococcaceae cyanobacterium SM2_3_1]|nr:HlyD family efflux transporter periplasmic adaptor subunit [Synechococcaceae cyanobacterium SM2_3_1]
MQGTSVNGKPQSRADIELNSKPQRFALANLLVAAAGIGLVGLALQLLHQRMTSIMSRDAVINGILIDLKAPETGEIAEMNVQTGDAVHRENTLVTLRNDRVSRLEVQSLQSKMNGQRAELSRLAARQQSLRALLQDLEIDQAQQHRLQIQEAEQSVAQVTSQLAAARAEYEIAQVNYNRTTQLVEEGALSKADLESALLTLEQSKAEVDYLQARQRGLRADEGAARLGLTLERSVSNYDPRIRLQELELQLADNQQIMGNLQQSIADSEAELREAQLDLERQQFVTVEMPTDGVIWRLESQPGQFLQRGESLGKLLDCSRRWVDAFVDERAVRQLQPGTPASIKLYGSESVTLQGEVSLVRSGLGRLAAGEDVAIPLRASSIPRLSQIRVELDSSEGSGDPNHFCYVGYTAEVRFQANPLPFSSSP